MEKVKQEMLKAFLKSTRNACLDTHDWFVSLLETGALSHEDIREYNKMITEVNEKMRKKLAKRYSLAEFK